MITYTFLPPSSYTAPKTISSSTTLSELLERQREKYILKVVDKGYWIKPTGSRVTKSGWTIESDWDYVIFDPDKTLAHSLQKDKNWVEGGSGNGEEFASFKTPTQDGTLNFILVDKEEIWKKYIVATNLIKALDTPTKEERIKIFDSVFFRDKDMKAVAFE